MQTHDIDYRCEAVNLRGHLAFDETVTTRRPGVLVFHEGLGLGDFAMARARMLAELGYVALAADMFGDRRQARNLREVADLSAACATNRRRCARGAAPRWRRLPPCPRSMRAVWVRSVFASAARSCSNSRATAPILPPSSASTASSQPKRPRFPATSRPVCWCAPAPTIRWRRQNK